MPYSCHYLAAFWLARDVEAKGTSRAATAYLNDLLAEDSGFKITEGGLAPGYDPTSPRDHPTFAWAGAVWEKLLEEPKPWLDTTPEPAPWIRDPDREVGDLLAFHFRHKSTDRIGRLQVHAGRDFVVFHQSFLDEIESPSAKSLQDESELFLRPRDLGAPLFTATVVHVSQLGETAEGCEPKGLREELAEMVEDLSKPKVEQKVLGDGQSLEISRRVAVHRFVEHRPQEPGGAGYRGRICSEILAGPKTWSSAMRHDAAGELVVALAHLLVGAEKILYEAQVARRELREVESGYRKLRCQLEGERQALRGRLGDPVHYTKVEKYEELQNLYQERFNRVDQLVATCQQNDFLFEDLGGALFPGNHRWFEETRRYLRNLVRDLRAQHRVLERELRSVTEAVRTFLAAGTRSYADAYARRLLRLSPVVEEKSKEDLYLPLICLRSAGQKAACKKGTCGALWEVVGEEAAADNAGRQPTLAVRPREIEKHWYEQLARYYGASAQSHEFKQLEGLVHTLLSPEGQIWIEEQEGEVWVLPIGQLLDARNEYPEGEPAWPLIARQLSKPAEVALQAMIALLVALDRLLEAPPLHLQQATSDRNVQRPRLLEALGALHLVVGQPRLGEKELHRAIRLHISQGNVKRAYALSQWICRIEDVEETTAASNLQQSEMPVTEKPPKQPLREWRWRLARDFLFVFDIRSAVALARSERPSKPGVKFQKRPSRIRICLWVTAGLVLLGLPIADRLATHSLPAWLQMPLVTPQTWIVLAGALALFGGPFALVFGAGPRAAWHLLPELLYLRIFMPMVLAVLNLAAIQQTPAMLTSGSESVMMVVVVLSLLASGGLLYSRVRQVQRAAGRGNRETLACCLDVFSLAFLEAAALSTVFAVLYEALFEEKAETTTIYTIFSDIFLRPSYVLFVIAMLLFVGIGVQLMLRPEGQGAESGRDMVTGIGWDLEGGP